jgi:transcriptional regulator with XRE-family HTH domain
LEELVKDWLDWGLTPSQLREALEMSLLDTEGPLTGTLLTRESGGTCCGDERCEARSAGMWDGPTSLFDDRDASGLSPISYWRHMERLSLEAVANRLGVAVSELALWEHGALPPREHARALSAMFGVSLDFLLGLSKDPHEDLECARCGAEASDVLTQNAIADRFEQGWDVAGGTELVCPNCLMPGDLDW